MTQPPLGQGLGEGVSEPARGIGHGYGQGLADGTRLDGGPGNAQPGRKEVRVLDADASQVRGGRASTPFQPNTTCGLGIGQIGMEGVAFPLIGYFKVGMGGAVADWD